MLLVIYDVLDGERVTYQKGEETITFSISAEEQEMGTELKVTLLQPCEGLSKQGKE